MNIFFDVDYTIQGVDGTLRPGTKELFQRLKDDGHTIYIWSGVGIRWREVKEHGLEQFVTDCYMKPIPGNTYSADDLPVRPDIVVDDYPEVAQLYGGICVDPYYFNKNTDRQMHELYGLLADIIENGSSDDPHFYPKKSNGISSSPAGYDS